MKYLDAKQRRDGYSNKMAPPPDDKAGEQGTDALEGVAFASPSAKTKAEEAGLTAESFKRRKKSSDRGFTLADVERIAAATTDADEDAEG